MNEFFTTVIVTCREKKEDGMSKPKSTQTIKVLGRPFFEIKARIVATKIANNIPCSVGYHEQMYLAN